MKGDGWRRTKLELQEVTLATDAGGGKTEVWQKVKDVICYVRQVKGKKAYEAQQEHQSVVYEIRTAYNVLNDYTNISQFRFLYNNNPIKLHYFKDEDQKKRKITLVGAARLGGQAIPQKTTATQITFEYVAYSIVNSSLTITEQTASDYTVLSSDLSSQTIKKNGTTVSTIDSDNPLTLAIGDTLTVTGTKSDATANEKVTLIGAEW